MKCECGSQLMVIRVEDYPEDVKDKINYDRLCDVQCINPECNKVYYSQSYDWGKRINRVKDLEKPI